MPTKEQASYDSILAENTKPASGERLHSVAHQAPPLILEIETNCSVVPYWRSDTHVHRCPEWMALESY
jgi:hypothetical protein